MYTVVNSYSCTVVTIVKKSTHKRVRTPEVRITCPDNRYGQVQQRYAS